MGYMSRLPTSNEPSGNEWPYGPQDPDDDFSALLNETGKRCCDCKRVTMNRFLEGCRCPECRRSRERSA